MSSNDLNQKIELLKKINKVIDEHFDTIQPDYMSAVLVLDSVKARIYESRFHSVEAKLDVIMLDNTSRILNSLDEKTIKDFDNRMYESIEKGIASITKEQYEEAKQKMGL